MPSIGLKLIIFLTLGMSFSIANNFAYIALSEIKMVVTSP